MERTDKAGSTDRPQERASIRLATDRDIVIERMFDAPREAVFEAWTNPQSIAQWWDPSGRPLAQAEIDLRPGGRFRLVHEGDPAGAHAFAGTYREVLAPSLLVLVTPAPGGGETIGTLRFEASGRQTRLTMTMSCPSAEAREQLLRFGIDKGTARTLDNLGEHLVRRSAAGR